MRKDRRISLNHRCARGSPRFPRGAAARRRSRLDSGGRPGGATGAIARELENAGYRRIAKAQRFIVKGKYGPLRDGELERAKAWGAELARLGKAG